MTLGNAAFFAIVGTALWTILTAVTLARDISGVADGILPAVSLLSAIIQFLTALSLLLFFIAYHRSHP